MPKPTGFEKKVLDALKKPENFPPEFWSALINRVQNSPQMQITRDQLPDNTVLAATDDPSTSRKVEWRSDTRGGAVIADVQAYTGLGPTIVAESIGKTATEPSQAIVQTRNEAEVSGVGTSLTVEQNEAITAAKRRAAVYVPRESDGTLIGKTIFDSLEGSDFLLKDSLTVPAWQAYTPVWSGNSSPFSSTLGNGTLIGRYWRLGEFIEVNIYMLVGSTTTMPGGAWTFSVPGTITSTSFLGVGWAYDNSANAIFAVPISVGDGTHINPWGSGAGVGQLTSATLFTWTTNDALALSIRYQIA